MSIFGNNNCTAIQIKDHVIRYVTTKKPSLSTLKSSGESYLPEGIIEKGKIVDRDKFKRILRKSISRWKLKKQEIRFFCSRLFCVFSKIDDSKRSTKG
ncbi:MAG: hypothetical protein LRY73_03890 [Bacillus sp. (in: Bacteria)]|nr:hypothetical protein [Bacillus sp. (in: firmicutes)]